MTLIVTWLILLCFATSKSILPAVDGFLSVSQHYHPPGATRSSHSHNCLLLKVSSVSTSRNGCVETKETNFVFTKEEALRKTSKKRQQSTLKEVSDRWLFNFTYQYDVLHVPAARRHSNAPINKINNKNNNTTTGLLLIHPIGVGIARWYYDRLLEAFANDTMATDHINLRLVVPDLLASGTAIRPHVLPSNNKSSAEIIPPKHLPLWNISDWTQQLLDLMHKEDDEVDTWCIVANGGCAPIALQLAAQTCLLSSTWPRVSQVVISSAPRLPFFLQSTDPAKVQKAYRRLTGVLGRLFWWYACRNQGVFIQRFSERNLVANATNLGPAWTPHCYQTATRDGGASRYSTFAFLAGTLQDGCVDSLSTLKGQSHEHAVRIDLIRGRDRRPNRAKSWFWQRRRPRRKTLGEETSRQTFRDYVQETNGLKGGREILIGGRISLAHEDATGYRDALLSFLEEED